jgi:hypothetical protein
MAKYIQLWKILNIRRRWWEAISYSTCQNKGLTAYVIRLLVSVCTERRVPVISTATSYWACPGFRSRPGDLSSPMLFVVSSFPPGKCSDSILIKAMALASLTSGGRSVGIVRLRTTSHGVYDRFLSHPFLFMVHSAYLNSTPCSLSYGQRR